MCQGTGLANYAANIFYRLIYPARSSLFMAWTWNVQACTRISAFLLPTERLMCREMSLNDLKLVQQSSKNTLAMPSVKQYMVLTYKSDISCQHFVYYFTDPRTCLHYLRSCHRKKANCCRDGTFKNI